MHHIPSTSADQAGLPKTDPVPESKKSRKTKKPKTPKDRSPPKMKSLSISNDTHVSSFKGTTSAESHTNTHEPADWQLIRDEKFVEIKLQEFYVTERSNQNKLKNTENELYELAESSNDSGVRLIIEFAKNHEKYGNFVTAMAYRALGDGNTKLFERIREYAPDRLYTDGIGMMIKKLASPSPTERDIHHAISVIKMLLKDGVDCTKEQVEIIGNWAKKLQDQEFLAMFKVNT